MSCAFVAAAVADKVSRKDLDYTWVIVKINLKDNKLKNGLEHISGQNSNNNDKNHAWLYEEFFYTLSYGFYWTWNFLDHPVIAVV